MNRVLACDIDGVICNWQLGFKRLIREVLNLDLPPSDPTCWDWPQAAGISESWLAHLWTRIKADPSWWRTLQPLPGVIELASELSCRRNEGWETYFVTARAGRPKRDTEAWLQAQGFICPTVLMATRKGSIVRDLKAEVFVEDKISHCVEVARVAKECHVMLMKHRYNREGWGDSRWQTIESLSEILAYNPWRKAA